MKLWMMWISLFEGRPQNEEIKCKEDHSNFENETYAVAN